MGEEELRRMLDGIPALDEFDRECRASCEVVHPVVERWLASIQGQSALDLALPAWQGILCLSTIFLQTAFQFVPDLMESVPEELEDQITALVQQAVITGVVYRDHLSSSPILAELWDEEDRPSDPQETG